MTDGRSSRAGTARVARTDDPGELADSPEAIRALLQKARTIAVVGAKDTETEDAYRVPRYMQEQGYRILPVNPKIERALGERCVDSLAEIDEPIDIVNLFRASENVAGHLAEILALEPRPAAVWMQLGIHHGPTAAALRAVGIQVVQDRCIMVDHRRMKAEEGAA